MNAEKILRVRQDHKTIFRDILGQIPYAVSDPVAIFKYNRNGHKTIEIMTDILDLYGNTVVIPLNVTYPTGKYNITRVATIFPLSRHSQLVKLFEHSTVLYINREKAAEWEERTGKKLPLGSINPPFNEQDLAAFIPAKKHRSRSPSIIRIDTADNTNNHSSGETYNQTANTNNLDNNIVAEESKEFIVPPSKRFNYRKSEEYYQTANDERLFYGIDADGRQLMLRFNPPEIDAVYDKHKKSGTLFRAPNGKKSNLDNRSWLLVRTPAFKNWFGDWENNPLNSSKVLDDNGEPLLVIHQAGYGGFSVFDTTGKFGMFPDKTRGTGAWFADTKGQEPAYGHKQEGENIYHVFLNIRNPYIHDAEGRAWNDLGRIWIADENGGEPIYYDNDGKPFLYDYQAREYIRTVLHSNPRYYYEHDRKYPTTDDLVRAVRKGRLGNGKYDGVIIKNVVDLGLYNPIDDYIIFKPIQVKSKFNNGAFSNNNNEIYKQSANLQNNPLVETYSQLHTFGNPNAENAYRRGQQQHDTPKSIWQRLKQSLRELRKGFKGDFPLLAGQEAKAKGLTAAREILRIMNRNTGAKSHMVMTSLYDSLHSLNAEQFNIFSRLMLLNDIRNFALRNPMSREHLPLGYNAQSLVRDYNISGIGLRSG